MPDGTFGRRRLFAYTGLAAASAAVAGCQPARTAGRPARKQQAKPVTLVTRREQVYSACRQRTVELFVAYPSGLRSTRGLPMVLYLHGRDGVQPTPIPYNTLSSLERAHRNGSVRPFGFVSVEGGFNPYWQNDSANGDLLSMITDEVPGWLRDRDLADQQGLPFAAAGLSTGGFGALNYAIERNRAGRPLAALGELAPALPVTWEHMREKQVFDTEAQWREADPMNKLDELGDVPVGIWIGDADPFREGAMRLANEHQNTPVVSVRPGGHEPPVFESVGEDMVHFLAGSAPIES